MNKINIGLIIAFSLLISLITVSAFTTENQFISGDFWNFNSGTVVLNNTAWNVNIGENATTLFKLKVNGTSFFNNSVVINKKTLSFNSGLNVPPYIVFGFGTFTNQLFDLMGSYNRNIWFGNTYNSVNISSGYPSPVAKILLFANGTIVNKQNTFTTGNTTVGKNINLSVSEIVGVGGYMSKINFGTYGTIYMNDVSSSPYYLNIESDDSIKFKGSNIKFDGTIGLDDNIYFGFGTGSLGNPDFFIGYNNTDSSLRFRGSSALGNSAKKFHFNNNNINTDFEIDGDTVDKVFCLDASLDKINMTKVNVTGLFTIPCISTGATLTSYQTKGSLLLNITTNLIGSYNGIAWKWR